MPIFTISLLFLSACTSDTEKEETVDPCSTDDALATCLEPTQTDEYYISQSSAYFDTMDYRVDLEDWPPYSEMVARWEWPPWLKLTAFTRENIETTDTLLVLYPSIVEDRICEAFDTQPFGRCYVVFYYDDHDGKPCPIYEEFTFNDQGEITFIEAWSDLDGFRPQDKEADFWAEAPDVQRLSTRIPGLGNATGLIDINGEAMIQAAENDEDVADFVYRANNWQETWMAEYEMMIETMWTTGCGWE